jgi:hypothetical protein
MTIPHPPVHQRDLNDSFLETRWLFAPRIVHALIATLSLVFSGCANQGYKVVSVTYQYTDQNRLTREWRALLNAQDQCYFAGFQYAQAVGSPQIVSDDGTAGEQRATRSFYCIGLRGGEG